MRASGRGYRVRADLVLARDRVASNHNSLLPLRARRESGPREDRCIEPAQSQSSTGSLTLVLLIFCEQSVLVGPFGVSRRLRSRYNEYRYVTLRGGGRHG